MAHHSSQTDAARGRRCVRWGYRDTRRRIQITPKNPRSTGSSDYRCPEGRGAEALDHSMFPFASFCVPFTDAIISFMNSVAAGRQATSSEPVRSRHLPLRSSPESQSCDPANRKTEDTTRLQSKGQPDLAVFVHERRRPAPFVARALGPTGGDDFRLACQGAGVALGVRGGCGGHRGRFGMSGGGGGGVGGGGVRAGAGWSCCGGGAFVEGLRRWWRVRGVVGAQDVGEPAGDARARAGKDFVAVCGGGRTGPVVVDVAVQERVPGHMLAGCQRP